MSRLHRVALALAVAAGTALLCVSASAADERILPVDTYRSKMQAGWLGQMIGVTWGAPTEFKYCGRIMPGDGVPQWQAGMANQAFGQDDLYVEMTFLRTLEEHGLDVSARQAGIDFANSEYALWCANRSGRNNLRKGIAPPDSGHPQFSRNSDDIDYQIEADFSGLIAPGLPGTVIGLGDKFGHVMNYGDGVYGGQFVGGMYAEAFFEDDIVKVIRAGLACIPAESQYAGMVRDVMTWWREQPDDWQATWQRINDKYLHDPNFRRYPPGFKDDHSIDVKLNGAYIVMGLLYGGGDIERTVTISMRCGQDSDCNPSNAAGVLCTILGMDGIAEGFKQVDQERKFSYTAYSFPGLLAVSEKLAREAIADAGGRVEQGPAGEVFVIPARAPRPGPLEQSWEPGPVAEARFTPQEMEQIRFPDAEKAALDAVAPGWTLENCGQDMGAPSLLSEYRGRKGVLITHPLDKETGCTLTRTISLPEGKTSRLRLVLGHFSRGDWALLVKADGQQLLEQVIGADTTTDGWLEVKVDLSAFAGREVKLELLNQPNGWAWEAGYWASVAVESD